jgi:hypothetical protein
MEKKVKKKYEKPRITRISLDAKGAVLGFCKTESLGVRGPGQVLLNHCNPPAGCYTLGS